MTLHRILVVALVVATAACAKNPDAAVRCEAPAKGGVATVTPKQALSRDLMRQSARVLRSRADAAFGASGVCERGDRIEVRIPKGATAERAESVFGTRGALEFRPVRSEIPPGTAAWSRSPSCAAGPDRVAQATNGSVLCVRGTGPGGAEISPDQWSKLVVEPPALGNGDIATAEPLHDAATSMWRISLSLTTAGARAFASITGRLACRPAGTGERQIAIVVDSLVVSHPQVGEDVGCNEGIAGGRAQIAGDFSETEAKDLAAVIAGSLLPAEFAVEFEMK